MTSRGSGQSRAAVPVQEEASLAISLMSTSSGDGATLAPAESPDPGNPDHVSAADGFGADALPLRPAAERSEEQEREERLKLMAGGTRRRVRAPRVPRRGILAGGGLAIAIVLAGVLLSRPRHGGEPAAPPQPRPTLTSAIGGPARQDLAAAGPAIGPAHALAHEQHPAARDPGRRRRTHGTDHRRRQAEGSTAVAREEPATAVTPVAAPVESTESPAPEPTYEPPTTPAPEPEPTPAEDGSKEPTQPTTSTAGEAAAGQQPTAVERQFGFER